MLIPAPKGKGNQLEFLTFNVGEGAFHWVRHHDFEDIAGWIYDCGTRSSKNLINKAVADVLQTIGSESSIPLLIISHYHHDHHSHLKSLASSKFSQRSLDIKEIWIPKIDPYSMTLYLRVLAFGTLLKYKNSIMTDKGLTRIFSKSGHLQEVVSIFFPMASVTMAQKGDERNTSNEKSNVKIKALTPPCFPSGKQHPLAESVAMITFMLNDSVFANSVMDILKNIINILRSNISFRAGTEEIMPLKPDFPERIMNLLQSPPFSNNNQNESVTYEKDNLDLHKWLAASLLVPDKEVPRLSVSDKNTLVPPSFRGSLLDFPQKIHDATHLFNLVVQISENDSSLLLTGDADVRLWPTILDGCEEKQMAVQVAHHGSRDNVDFCAFDRLQSNSYIVSAGKYKNWKHPSTKLGLAVSGSKCITGLYCTNVHDNCEIKTPSEKCRKHEIQAISVTSEKVEWIIDGVRCPAIKCSKL